MSILKMPNISTKNGIILDKSVAMINVEPAIILKNKKEVASIINEEKILLLKQIHSKDIIFIDEKNVDDVGAGFLNVDKSFIGDGMITALKNVAICTTMADCVTVFIYSPKNNIIAILHSGWRSTFLGINENILDKLNAIGISSSEIEVAISPSIKQVNYDVDEDFYTQFAEQSKESIPFFKKIDSKWHFDNCGYIEYKYKKSGVLNIYKSPLDTYTTKGLFSHRYAKKHTSEINGRTLSFICLK